MLQLCVYLAYSMSDRNHKWCSSSVADLSNKALTTRCTLWVCIIMKSTIHASGWRLCIWTISKKVNSSTIVNQTNWQKAKRIFFLSFFSSPYPMPIVLTFSGTPWGGDPCLRHPTPWTIGLESFGIRSDPLRHPCATATRDACCVASVCRENFTDKKRYNCELFVLRIVFVCACTTYHTTRHARHEPRVTWEDKSKVSFWTIQTDMIRLGTTKSIQTNVSPHGTITTRYCYSRCLSSSLPAKTLSCPGTVNLSSKSVRLYE